MKKELYIKAWKRAWEDFKKDKFVRFLLIVAVGLVIIMGVMAISNSCTHVDKKRAIEFYDKSVKNFPEENI